MITHASSSASSTARSALTAARFARSTRCSTRSRPSDVLVRPPRREARPTRRVKELNGQASAAPAPLMSAGNVAAPPACSERKRDTPKGAAAAR
ncbi:MAG: hypothetical protein LC795_20990 [Acidobacteria bacterium]|nr:hypothetical protein [Acidobacteriota bacterium]